MKSEKRAVEFPVKVSTAENCTCSACHGSGRVTKLRLPETLYHDRRNLTTKYSEYWLCKSCRDKLLQALTETKEA